jgi:mono/diheme cytochrome c family protein
MEMRTEDAAMKVLLNAIPLIVMLSVSAAAQDKPPRDDPNSGRMLYRTYCATCHGVDGRGNGPAAGTLLTPVPDLTTITLRRAGEFPAGEMAQVIDGRQPLPAHMRGEMPRWGVILDRMELKNERAVKDRIAALVAYLEALQRKQ